MSNFRNIKVYVPTPEISEAVQRELFKSGVRWSGEGNSVDFLCSKYLFVDKHGILTKIDYGINFFKGEPEKEVTYQSILDPHYEIKIAWANGEAIQYKLNGIGEWTVWEQEHGLSIGFGEEWRVKPKTKTIKQWERKHWDGTFVNTMKSLEKPLQWSDKLKWIGDAYEAEYEVPCD